MQIEIDLDAQGSGDDEDEDFDADNEELGGLPPVRWAHCASSAVLKGGNQALLLAQQASTRLVRTPLLLVGGRGPDAVRGHFEAVLVHQA
jgi:hypothetical protein